MKKKKDKSSKEVMLLIDWLVFLFSEIKKKVFYLILKLEGRCFIVLITCAVVFFFFSFERFQARFFYHSKNTVFKINFVILHSCSEILLVHKLDPRFQL